MRAFTDGANNVPAFNLNGGPMPAGDSTPKVGVIKDAKSRSRMGSGLNDSSERGGASTEDNRRSRLSHASQKVTLGPNGRPI
mmetsp:Transcript_39817/g.52121  ORF Transcript_39817/g.52121 Transcript_39817/m.52121 type:complete len:82 (+) Transcript_39817:906-1151(+)